MSVFTYVNFAIRRADDKEALEANEKVPRVQRSCTPYFPYCTSTVPLSSGPWGSGRSAA